MKSELGTWVAVQEVTGINRGHAWRLAKGTTRASLATYNLVMGHDPSLVREVTVEVPPGSEVKVYKPGTRQRKKRYSVPTEPGEAAFYLSDRMGKYEMEDFIKKLRELNEVKEFEYGYE